MVLDQLLHIMLSSKGEVAMWLELDVWLVEVILFTISICRNRHLVLQIPDCVVERQSYTLNVIAPQEICPKEGGLYGLWQAGLHPDAQRRRSG